MRKYSSRGSRDNSERINCVVCGHTTSNRAEDTLTGLVQYVCEYCIKNTNPIITACAFPRKFYLSKNLRNSISRYTFAGDKISVQGQHPWDGISASPCAYVKCSGNEHEVFTNNWKGDMMVAAGYEEVD